jgi:quercetin dioxygenase-like cupin family protein
MTLEAVSSCVGDMTGPIKGPLYPYSSWRAGSVCEKSPSQNGDPRQLAPEAWISMSGSISPMRFLDSLVTFRLSTSDGQDGISILEHRLPHGSSPPLHVHCTEDEVFHVLEGELRVRVQDQERRFGAGETFLAPKGVPHTYRVESPQGARCLTITVKGDFERFVREMGRPPDSGVTDAPVDPPSGENLQQLIATAARHGIKIVGPPLG